MTCTTLLQIEGRGECRLGVESGPLDNWRVGRLRITRGAPKFCIAQSATKFHMVQIDPKFHIVQIEITASHRVYDPPEEFALDRACDFRAWRILFSFTIVKPIKPHTFTFLVASKG